MFYLWVVLWIKRFHQAGRSGVFALIPIILFPIGLYFTASFIFAEEFKTLMEAYESDISIEDLALLMDDLVKPKEVLYLLVATLYSLAFLHISNRLITSDPNANQYGPA